MYNIPEFTDPYNNDFSLQSTSTLIGAAQSGYDMGANPFTVRPLMPTDLEIMTTPNELDVDLSWVNPTENTDGTAITSITSVKVIRNGETVAELTGSPGAAMQYSETLTVAAECRYMVLAVTDIDGLYCFTRSSWIGPPAWSNPTGPDAYGYTAVESVDPNGPNFDWIEYAPAAGGLGTEVTELTGQDDASVALTLPFTFQYYGMEYNQITICTNGWLAFGDQSSEVDWSNSAIPDSDGPTAMLAPFWEDLNLEIGGEIATYFNAPLGWFIVEFYQVPQWSPETALETFQVVLYDPAVYPSATGDGEILVQYLDVSDPTEATFGIENQAEAVGLEMGMDNNYAASCAGIQDNYAILFTPPAEPFPLDVTLTPVGAPIVIPAAGGSFDFTVDLSAPLSSQTFDCWIDVVLPNNTAFGPVLSRELTLSGGASLSRDMTQNIPGNAPQGIYTYRSFIGDAEMGIVWSMDSFEFQKDAVGDGLSGSWACTEREVVSFGLSDLPETTALQGNYPNPFNPTTAISIQLSAFSKVNLSVYDISGRKVATLIDGYRDAGYHEATFDASALSSGVYLAKLTAGDFSAVSKMMLVK